MAAVIDKMKQLQASAGFADPVHDSQAVFRAVLQALSRPGQKHDVYGNAVSPSPMSPVMAAIALTLLDQDVVAWLSPSLACKTVRDYLAFHAGVAIIADPGTAAFVLCASPSEIPPLRALSQGTPAYPDRSATVVVDISGVRDAEPVSATLSGPGIEQPLLVSIPGFTHALWQQLQINHADYPLGIDVLVCTGNSVIGLPRSTSIEVA